MHWKLQLSYDGSDFHGWQVQPGRATIQGALSGALHQLTGETVLPQGSGRTDAGVHALGQVTSFSLTAPIPAENLLRALNRALPSSIRVLSAEPVPESFHARYSALRKTYEYRIFRGTLCPPFLARYAWDCPWKLELGPMQQAAEMLVGTHDFTSFAASDPDLSTRNSSIEPTSANTRSLFLSEIHVEEEQIVYRVTGSGFLHHMVRNLVGTLVEIGRGALTPNDIPRILVARDRSAAGPTAPPQGLFLVSVDYEETA